VHFGLAVLLASRKIPRSARNDNLLDLSSRSNVRDLAQTEPLPIIAIIQ
jgi:hypothetical protein